jgi:hypothetical protein
MWLDESPSNAYATKATGEPPSPINTVGLAIPWRNQTYTAETNDPSGRMGRPRSRANPVPLNPTQPTTGTTRIRRGVYTGNMARRSRRTTGEQWPRSTQTSPS